MTQKKKKAIVDPVQTELDCIKRLLILLLIKLGATSDEIAAALKMHPGAVRKLVPGREIRKIDVVKK
jgi:DNA-binding CsgD family transcriptional regulator